MAMSFRYTRGRTQSVIIFNGLQELSNESATGRNCWVTFDANSMEHWFQCTPTLLRVDWPFSSRPTENEFLKQRFGSGQPLQIHSWQPDSYVTFTPSLPDVDSLVAAIDDTFRELYGLGDNYVIAYKLESR
jgi:hypothetical protein